MNEREKFDLKMAWLKVIAFGFVAMIFIIAGAPLLSIVPTPLLFGIGALIFLYVLVTFLKKMLDQIEPPNTTPHDDLPRDNRRLD